MSTKELKEQLQEDILSILEGHEIDKALCRYDYDCLAMALCDVVIKNVNQLNQQA